MAADNHQFVLFAFFILNRAKGEAISTGILFFLTLGLKLVYVSVCFVKGMCADSTVLLVPSNNDSTSESLAEVKPDQADHPASRSSKRTSSALQSRAKTPTTARSRILSRC